MFMYREKLVFYITLRVTDICKPFQNLVMGWLFRNSPGGGSPSTGPENSLSETLKERELIGELPESLASFYELQNRQNKFRFNETNQDPQFDSYVAGKEPKELAAINCADIQMQFLDCVTNGEVKERLLGCDKQSTKVTKCLDFQKLLFNQLGLSKARNPKRFEDIVGGADAITSKWLDSYDTSGPLPEQLQNDIYDKRDQIWK